MIYRLDVFVEFFKPLYTLLQLILLLLDVSVIVALLSLFVVQSVLIHLLFSTHRVQLMQLGSGTLTCLLLQTMVFLHLTTNTD